MNTKDELAILESRLYKKREIVSKELRNLPKGALYIYKDGKYTRYAQAYTDKQQNKRIKRSIARDKVLISKLARKRYLQIELDSIDANIAVIKKAKESLLAEDMTAIMHAVPKSLLCLPSDSFTMSSYVAGSGKSWPRPTYDEKLLPRSVTMAIKNVSPEEYKYMAYRQNEYRKEGKIVKTRRGLAVRSKSEAAIMEIYDLMNIAVHYDELVSIYGEWISPDFIFMRQDGSLVYHEHFGYLGDVNYRQEVLSKIKRYESAGICLWNNLLITFDDLNGGIDIKYIEAAISHYYDITKKN